MPDFTAFGRLWVCSRWDCEQDLSILTGGAKGRLFGPRGGAHGPSGAAETAGRSGGRAVSARLTGHLARWSDRTAVTGGTEVTMGTVGGSGSGAAAQAHVSVDVKQQAPGLNRENVTASCWRRGRTGCQQSRREERVGGGTRLRIRKLKFIHANNVTFF